MLTDMTHLALPTTWNARRPSEYAHLINMVNLIPPTDQPPAYPGRVPWANRACWLVGLRSGLKYSAGKGPFRRFS